jgi:hypothetical protein
MVITSAELSEIAKIILDQAALADKKWRSQIGESVGDVYATIVARFERMPNRPDNLTAYVAQAARYEAGKWHTQQNARAKKNPTVSYDDTMLRLEHRRGGALCQTERISPIHQRYFMSDDAAPDKNELLMNEIGQAYSSLPAEKRELVASLAHLPDAPSIAALAKQRKRSRQSVHRSARRAAVIVRQACTSNIICDDRRK